jgi:dipeptidyl aminopeptidase/acylaminoacyl peptidase
MPRPFDIAQLLRIPKVWTYDVSPDGSVAAFESDQSGQHEIYLIPLHRRGKAKPRRITTGPESKVFPRFSPDGARLAFAQDYSGDEKFDILIYDLRTGETHNLTPDTPDETINPFLTWSPDGQQIAYVSNRAGTFATFILNRDGSGEPRRVTRHEYSDFAAEWSPDGRYLAVTAQAKGQEHWTFLVPVTEEGESKIIGGPDGPLDAIQPRWSPDGRRVVFTSNSPGIYTLFTYDLETGALTQETDATHEAAEPDWSPDGERISFTWNEDGNVSIGLKELATGAITSLRVAPGVHSIPRFARAGEQFFFLFNGAGYPQDLWAYSLSSKRKRQLTRSLPKQLRPRDFVTPKVVRWPSDGLIISGLLYLPKGIRPAKNLPAILHVHGGPTWQYKNEWYPTVQHLVSQGYVVLAPNYRGSTGYGRKFQEANRFDLGGGDMRDVLGGAEFLIRQGYADAQRIAITGVSYGGYLTMTALTRHPHVFAAGSALVPFLNWFTEHANEREDLQYWDLQNFGDPVKDADRYREYSPIYFMENIVAPVQMIAGANDPRCPADETEQAAAALKEMDAPYEIIIYPDEGHGFRKTHNRIDAYDRRAEFFNKHLGMSRPKPGKRITTKSKKRSSPSGTRLRKR